MFKGNEVDCICHKPNGKHVDGCNAFRLAEFFKKCGGAVLVGAKAIRNKAEQDIADLQERCEHKKSTWGEECWAPGHFTGKSLEVCDFCEKTLNTTTDR